MMKAIPVLLMIVSCALPGTVERAAVKPDKSIVAIESRCIDTLRTLLGTTKSVPHTDVYRDEAYVFQIRAEIDLRVHKRGSKLAMVALTPDDSLSLHLFSWNEAINVSPTTATFSFLVKTSKPGTAHFSIVREGQKEFIRREVRETGIAVNLEHR